MSNLLPDTDSEDEMPQGWEEKISQSDRVYYVKYVLSVIQVIVFKLCRFVVII